MLYLTGMTEFNKLNVVLSNLTNKKITINKTIVNAS